MVGAAGDVCLLWWRPAVRQGRSGSAGRRVGRAPQWESTVAAQRHTNIHLHDGVSEASFVGMRMARDKTLEMPNLILPAIQVNIRAGELPPPEANGVRYLKIPLNVL